MCVEVWMTHVCVCVCVFFYCCTLSHSLEQRWLREAEASAGDAVHKVEGDPDEALAVEEDKVVLEDQQRAVGDQDQALPVVVPVVHPEDSRGGAARDSETKSSIRMETLKVNIINDSIHVSN